MRAIYPERSQTGAGRRTSGPQGAAFVPSTCQTRRAVSCNSRAVKKHPLLSVLALFGFWCFHFGVAPPPLRPSALTSSARPCLSAADTRYTVEDIEGALLKQMKASKDTGIAVKKPEDQNIRFTNYGNSAGDLAGGSVPGISGMKGDFLSYS